MRQEDQIHVAGLPQAFPELTVSHTQVLLAVPVEALGAWPAASIGTEDTTDLPMRSIAHQYLLGFLTITSSPQDDDTDTMINTRYANTPCEIPLLLTIDRDELTSARFDLLSQYFGLELASLETDVAIELQITDIASIMLVDMVEILRVRKPTVEGEVARDVICDHPVDELSEEDVVIIEDEVAFFTALALYEAAKVNGIMLAAGADVIGDQIVVRHRMPFLGVIPEIPDVFDSLAVMIDQDIVHGDDALCAVTGGRVFLEPLEPPPIQFRDVPCDLIQPAIQT